MRLFISLLKNIHFVTVLFVMIVLDVWWGYLSVSKSPEVFKALNDVGLVEWFITYGLEHLSLTVWLGFLLIFLSLLVLSTVVCTIARLANIIKHYKTVVPFRFAQLIAPHIMHYGVVILLSGYLLSYLFASTSQDTILIKGGKAKLPDSAGTLVLNDINVEFYGGNRIRSFKGKAIEVKGILLFKDLNGRTVRRAVIKVNRPVWFNGVSIHIVDFAPRTMRNMYREPFLRIVARKDPGVWFYFAGTFVFLTGLFVYIAPFALRVLKATATNFRTTGVVCE